MTIKLTAVIIETPDGTRWERECHAAMAYTPAHEVFRKWRQRGIENWATRVVSMSGAVLRNAGE